MFLISVNRVCIYGATLFSMKYDDANSRESIGEGCIFNCKYNVLLLPMINGNRCYLLIEILRACIGSGTSRTRSI